MSKEKKNKNRFVCLSKDNDMLVDSGINFICTIGKVKQKVMRQDMENVNLALHRSRFERTRMKIYFIYMSWPLGNKQKIGKSDRRNLI